MSLKTTRRAYCRCVAVESFDYDQAAAKLGCKKSWLEANIADLPHQKRGASVAFCDCELALIQAMTTVVPDAVLELLNAEPAEEETPAPPVSSLATITPAQGRRRRSSAAAS